MTDAPMTPERRAEIDALVGDHATCWTLDHPPFLHQAALDLRAECDRLAAELERSVSDHEACIEIIHKSDDEHARLSAALDAERKVTAGMRAVCDAARDEKRHADRIRNPAILDKDSPYSDYRKAVERLRDAVAALDAKEPTR